MLACRRASDTLMLVEAKGATEMARATRRTFSEEPPPALRVDRSASSSAGGGEGEHAWRLCLTEPARQRLHVALDRLTPRELEVVFAICDGGSNELIADRLCIALPTLRTHLMRIHQKLGSASKSDIVRCVSARLLRDYRRGLIEPAAVTPATGAAKPAIADERLALSPL